MRHKAKLSSVVVVNFRFVIPLGDAVSVRLLLPTPPPTIVPGRTTLTSAPPPSPSPPSSFTHTPYLHHHITYVERQAAVANKSVVAA
ncbi:hypothetical protein DFH27DRAFT_606380 [Peziza echinospora]|nr:hypothetical protein DFH27DRAFT_606380 [Peziza echinospora]